MTFSVKKAILVAPNLGTSFAGGGGSSVAANVAQTMLQNGSNVTLSALSGYSKEILDEIHGTDLSRFGDKVTTDYIFNRRFENRGAHKVASSPATMLALLGFHNCLSIKIKREKPDMIWFNDDVPRFCEGTLRHNHSVQYVNFSFLTRLRIQVDEQWEDYEEGKLNKKDRCRTQKSAALVGKKALACDTVIANSSVTSRYLKETDDCVQALTIYPPVNVADREVFQKNPNQMAAIGAFRPNKRFGDLIRAVSISKLRELRLLLVGLQDDDNYLRYLKRLVKNLGLQNRVLLIPNATRVVLNRVLCESSAVLSAARFEPFGIAIAEGMSRNCVPIVFAGEDSGPWVDIVQRGNYGYGFSDNEELSEIFGAVSNKEDKKIRRKLRARARDFNSEIFRKRIREIVQRKNT